MLRSVVTDVRPFRTREMVARETPMWAASSDVVRLPRNSFRSSPGLAGSYIVVMDDKRNTTCYIPEKMGSGLPRCSNRAKLLRVQLHQNSSHPAYESPNGRWPRNAALVSG